LKLTKMNRETELRGRCIDIDLTVEENLKLKKKWAYGGQKLRGEIDRDFYCSAGYVSVDFAGGYNCPMQRLGTPHDPSKCKECTCYHCKHPTLEQFKREYGRNYSADGAVYFRYAIKGEKPKPWRTVLLYEAVEAIEYAEEYGDDDDKRRQSYHIVCACTPWGQPPDDWRPEARMKPSEVRKYIDY